MQAALGFVVLARPARGAARVFPPIGAALYQSTATADSTADQQAAIELLHLANRPMSFVARYLGWRDDSQGRTARVVFHHRMALEAELAGRWRRADYFWREFIDGLRRLQTEPAHLRELLVDEIAIDTHCAAYNALGARGDADSLRRASVHLDYLKQLLPLSRSPEQDLRPLIAPALQRRVEQLKSARDWRRAIQEGRFLLTAFPDQEEYASALVETYIARTLSRMRTGKKARGSADAEDVQRCIRRVERLLQNHPTYASLYTHLGFLHLLHAVKLANAERLSDALVAAQRALTFDPSRRDAEATKTQLLQEMHQKQARVTALEADLKAKPNSRLNVLGLQMQADARKGFDPMIRYFDSEEARRTAEARVRAHAQRVTRTNQPAAGRPARAESDWFVLPAAPRRRWRGTEPVVDWLFSRQDWLVKTEAALAAVLVLGIGGLSIREAGHQQVRDLAFQQLADASARHDDLAVMSNAEAFLSNPPLNGKDGRTAFVKNGYSDSLARWFVEHGGRPETEAATHVERYRLLIVAPESRGT